MLFFPCCVYGFKKIVNNFCKCVFAVEENCNKSKQHLSIGRYSSPTLWWYWSKINKCASEKMRGMAGEWKVNTLNFTTAYCILYYTLVRKTKKNRQIEGQTRVPTACPTACSVLWISHRMLFTTAHGHNKHNILLCCHFDLYHTGVKRSWAGTSQRSRQPSHSVQIDNGYSITKYCCMCMFVWVCVHMCMYCLWVFLDHSKGLRWCMCVATGYR